MPRPTPPRLRPSKYHIASAIALSTALFPSNDPVKPYRLNTPANRLVSACRHRSNRPAPPTSDTPPDTPDTSNTSNTASLHLITAQIPSATPASSLKLCTTDCDIGPDSIDDDPSRPPLISLISLISLI